VVALASRLMRRSTDLRVDRLEALKRWVAAHRGRRPAAPYRIVVALDSASGARVEALNRALLDAALRIARMQPSMITVLTVLATQDTGMADGEREAQIINASYHSARTRIHRLMPPSNSSTAPIGINVRTGNVVEAISACVADYGADLLVIGARERNAVSRFLLGSTTYKALTTISCPVFVVREQGKPARTAAAPVALAELAGGATQGTGL
jgi:nucleotide-binding universal stress UspA family protein